MFTLGMIFSISAPIVLFLSTIYFIIRYYVDKYNFIYIYPADIESKRIIRSSLVLYPILAIILF
jgi:hypothetical protein